jgi:hypothetical protein
LTSGRVAQGRDGSCTSLQATACEILATISR